ncbi:MAG TPA: PAS domain S-box protein, partial [Roseiflexaceae bacterium]|nr:PAS domain S-box protein [Roseiflexaceae bacterium]
MDRIDSSEARVALGYALFGLLWILISDHLLILLIHDTPTQQLFQTYKGWFFVLCSAILIYALQQREKVRRSAAEARLAITHERYRMLTEYAHDAILFIRYHDGRILEANPAAQLLYGYTADELRSLSIMQLRAPQTQSVVAQQLTQARKDGIRFETIHRHHDGSSIPVDVSSRGMELNGEPVVISIIRDLSEQRFSEIALRDSDLRFRAIFDQAAIGIAQVDLDGRVVRGNRALCHMLGYSAAELTAMHFRQYAHPHDTAADLALFAELIAGQRNEYDLEKRYLRKDGSEIWGRLTVSLVRDDTGMPLFAIRMLEDISLRKQHEEALLHKNIELQQAYEATIEGWSKALDLRDHETEGHTQRVTAMALRLGRACRLSESELRYLRWGSLLHDIGKMGVPDTILLKPGPLDDAEWAVMRRHPVLAYELLQTVEYLRPAIDIPYYHHERWDGSGYPCGLRGEAIPLAARIFAVVDVWDALCSDRPYRQA